MLWLTLLVLMILIAAAPLVPLTLERYTQPTSTTGTGDGPVEPS